MRNEEGRRWWKCYRCADPEHYELGDYPSVPKPDRPKQSILYIDLEISKSLYFNYARKVPSKYLDPDDLVHEYYVICWVASYLGSNRIHWGCVTQDDALNWTDKNILAPLWELMDSADVIAGHNVDAFDVKRAKTRFFLNNMEPPKRFRTIDTLKIARTKLALESNRLDDISKRLGFRPKDDIRKEDWLRIVKTGDPLTLLKVLKYCAGDVESGKAILSSLLGWSEKPIDYGSVTAKYLDTLTIEAMR